MSIEKLVMCCFNLKLRLRFKNVINNCDRRQRQRVVVKSKLYFFMVNGDNCKEVQVFDLRKIINNELIIMLCILKIVIYKWGIEECVYFNFCNKSIKFKGLL